MAKTTGTRLFVALLLGGNIMNYNKIFKGKMDGPFNFRYRRDSRLLRPCYIVTRFCSGVSTVYCPRFIDTDETIYNAEFNLAKLDMYDNYIAYGKDHYMFED